MHKYHRAIYNRIDNKIKTVYYWGVIKLNEGKKMSRKEIAKLNREFGKVTYKQLIDLAYERAHDVSEERFILRRIPNVVNQ